MMGQISDDKNDPEIILKRLEDIGIATAEARTLINNMRIIPDEMIYSYVKIMTICAQYLTLSNAMPGAKPTVAESAKRYIYENIDKKITIKDICEVVDCSKTTLIASFKKEFGITVNAAITKAKLEEAKKLLVAGVLNINQISQATGFYDQAYFSKVFSSEYGVTPSEYKKEIQE